MLTFPCIAFREERPIFSMVELRERLEEANVLGKNCEVTLYGFSTLINNRPDTESVILDKVVYLGDKQELQLLGEDLHRQGYNGTLYFDGETYVLIIPEYDEYLTSIQHEGVEMLKDYTRKFTLPGYTNLKTKKKAYVVKRWNNEGVLDK